MTVFTLGKVLLVLLEGVRHSARRCFGMPTKGILRAKCCHPVCGHVAR